MAAAAAPGAPLAVANEVEWEIQDTIGNTHDDNARARGLAHMLEFNTAEPPPKKYLPVLPWAVVSGQTQVRLHYIAVACFTWAALVLHDTAAALFVDEWILRPSGSCIIKRARARLLQLGMPLLEVTVGTAANILARFVAEHPHAGFEIPNTDLQRVEEVQTPTRAADKPGKRSGHHCAQTNFFVTKLINAKRSMIPMCIYELATGLRTIATHAVGATIARFSASLQYTRILSKLYSANRMHHCSVAPRSNDKSVPANELADTHLMTLGEFFSTNSCPLTLLNYNFSNCAATMQPHARNDHSMSCLT